MGPWSTVVANVVMMETMLHVTISNGTSYNIVLFITDAAEVFV